MTGLDRSSSPLGSLADEPAPTVRVGSKVFTESVILGEIAVQLDRRRRESRSSIAASWAERRSSSTPSRPTSSTSIPSTPARSRARSWRARTSAARTALRAALAERGVGMSRPLGFNDTYAIGMREEVAARLGMPDALRPEAVIPSCKFGFSNEFMDRADGWPGLRDRYGLPAARRPRARPRPGLSRPGQRRDPGHRPLLDRRRDQGNTTSACSRRPRASSRRMSASGSIVPTCRRGRPRPSRPSRGWKDGSPRPRWPAMNAAGQDRSRCRGPRRGRVPRGRSSGSSRRSSPRRSADACSDGWASISTLVAISLAAAIAGGDPARHRRGAAAAARSGHPGRRRGHPDDPVAGAPGVHDPLAGDRGQAGAGRAVPLQPAADRPQHGHRACAISRRRCANRPRRWACPPWRGCSGSSCRWPRARSSRGSRRPR